MHVCGIAVEGLQGIPEQQALKEAQICTDWTGR